MNPGKFGICLAFGAVALSGCAVLPDSPSIAVMPAPGKPFEVFVTEDQFCRGLRVSSRRRQGSDGSQHERSRIGGRRNCARGCGRSSYWKQLVGGRYRCGRWLADGVGHRLRRRLRKRLPFAAPLRHCVRTMHVREGQPASGTNAAL